MKTGALILGCLTFLVVATVQAVEFVINDFDLIPDENDRLASPGWLSSGDYEFVEDAEVGRKVVQVSSTDYVSQNGLYQCVQVDGTEPFPLVAIAESQGANVNGLSTSQYSLYLDVTFTDDTHLWGSNSPFPRGSNPWTERVVVVNPTKPIKRVCIHLNFREHVGSAKFKNVRLLDGRDYPCYVNNGGCHWLAPCVHESIGVSSCGDCPSGFEGSGDSECTDIDECATNNGDCGDHVQCDNSFGSHTCAACLHGYVGDRWIGCYSIAEHGYLINSRFDEDKTAWVMAETNASCGITDGVVEATVSASETSDFSLFQCTTINQQTAEPIYIAAESAVVSKVEPWEYEVSNLWALHATFTKNDGLSETGVSYQYDGSVSGMQLAQMIHKSSEPVKELCAWVRVQGGLGSFQFDNFRAQVLKVTNSECRGQCVAGADCYNFFGDFRCCSAPPSGEMDVDHWDTCDEAYLDSIDLSVATGDVTMAFNKYTRSYTVDVDFPIESISIVAKKTTFPDATVTIDGVTAVESSKTLTVGANVIVVQIHEGLALGSYTITVNRSVADAKDGYSVLFTTLDFSKLNFGWPTISNWHGTYMQARQHCSDNGLQLCTRQAVRSMLKDGFELCTWLWTDDPYTGAQVVIPRQTHSPHCDGLPTERLPGIWNGFWRKRLYNGAICCPGGNMHADAQTMTMTPGDMEPSFFGSYYSYELTVGSQATSIYLTGLPLYGSTKITVNGEAAGGAVPLVAGGETTAYLTATTDIGVEQKYKVIVLRSETTQSSGELSGLSVGGVALTPGFSPSVYEYVARVKYPASNIQVTGTGAGGSTVRINGGSATATLNPTQSNTYVHVEAKDQDLPVLPTTYTVKLHLYVDIEIDWTPVTWSGAAGICTAKGKHVCSRTEVDLAAKDGFDTCDWAWAGTASDHFGAVSRTQHADGCDGLKPEQAPAVYTLPKEDTQELFTLCCA
eukprot:GFYU01001277.1.p1 GENE.GFYU01001277.1~~GFYU01001277.1.p1  ORF type:complete len:959 (+),score=326.65 GFYU01001277.1:341-3217(+)